MIKKKRCPKCAQTLPISKFYISKTKYDGLQTYCKQCGHKRRIQYYKENRETEDKRNKGVYINYLKRYEDYKKTLKCEKCGESRWYVLDFHHAKDDKKYNIGGMVANQMSWKTVMEEIGKCTVLCSNCHRELHFIEKSRDISVSA